MGTIAKVTAGGVTHLVASTAYGTCDTDKNVVAKVATIQDSQEFTLFTGVTVHIKFTYHNTATNPTLNVNNTGAKNIYKYGTDAPGTNERTSWNKGALVSFTYDGTNWMMNDWNDDTNTNTTYTLSTSGNNVVLTPSSGNADTITVPYASNADKLGGASPSESNVASTIVKRNSSGYVYAQYYNEANGAENPASYTSYAVFKDSNGWIRCSSLANFKSWFGAANYATLTNAGSTTGTTAKAFTVPAAATEIIVTGRFSSKILSATVPKALLTASNQEIWLTGGKSNATTSNQGALRCLCNLKLSGTTATLQGVACNNEGTDTTASTTWNLFYR